MSMTASEVAAYLEAHPEFFDQHSELLTQVRVPHERSEYAVPLVERQVLALRDTAHLWSPKVVRAGMGAHFGLRLIEDLDAAALAALQVPLLVTSSHAGRFLHAGALPWPCAWCFGHEGQGVEPALNARAQLQVQIAQPGGQESLNVAAAAAICLYQSARAQRG